MLLKIKSRIGALLRGGRRKLSPIDSNWIDTARKDLEGWYSDLEKHTTEEQRVDTASRLLIAAARLGFINEETKLKLFDKAQEFGAHFLTVHFYSPVPDTRAIPQNTFKQRYDDLPNLEVDKEKLLAFIDELSEYGAELTHIPHEPVQHQYSWNNPAFDGGDASILYSMIRKYRPRKIIEIGSGYSTLMGLEALKVNGQGDYSCIEPYPNEDIEYLANQKLIKLIRQPVQELPLDTFEALEEGDILFIDSTHVCKTGSDVVYEFLKILPRLKPGVVVHVHDIFFPFEYPEDWVVDKKIFWNEAYLLMAFLAFNDSFEVLVPNQIFLSEDYSEAFQKAFPCSPVIGGGSFWFRRKV